MNIEKVLPRIKVNYAHKIYEEDSLTSIKGNPLPEDVEIPEEQLPLTKNLYEDLLLWFALDMEDRYEVLQNDVLIQFPDWSIDKLQNVSTNNLIAEIGEQISLQGDSEYIMMVTAGGNFEATIILIDNFWKQIHEMIEGNLIIAIPAKDLLFFCKSENQEAIEQIKTIIQEYFNNPETQGLLSKALYLKEVDKQELTIYDTAF